MHLDFLLFPYLFLKDSIDMSLRDARILEYCGQKHEEVGRDTELAPEHVERVRPRASHLEHEVEVEKDHGGQEDQHRGERP